MKQLLITGFNPFDERGYNTSAAILEELPPAVGDFHLHKAVLPVEWNEGRTQLLHLCQGIRPNAILAMGMSKQSFLQFETRAQNKRNPALTDNLNLCPPDAWIDRDQPTALGATWPAPPKYPFRFSNSLTLEFSEDAGGYLCNQTFFLSAQYAKPLIPSPPVAFIHVPPRPEDGGQPVGVTAAAILEFLNWSLPQMAASNV